MTDALAFASCYAYAPRGESAASQQSKILCRRIKRADDEAVRLCAERVKQFWDDGQFRGFLGQDVTLVPTPGRAPLYGGAVNRTQRFGDAFVALGLAREVLALVERITPVAKSAYAAPGERPGVDDHLASMVVRPLLAAPSRIVVLDDVVTRGATLFAVATLLRRQYPGAEAGAFALVRTVSSGEIERFRDPREGTIERLASGGTIRRP